MASRTSNSLKNIASSLGLKFLILGLQFATRTIFINNLGSVYNGINSLVSSILSFLNMAELGIGAAIVYAMYRPIAEKDEEKTLQYLEYYKKIYHILGMFVLAIGLLIMPFFPMLTKDAANVVTSGELYVIYILYLINSVSSFYVYAYRGGLISAYQHDYRLTPINYTANVLIIVLQGASLIVFKGITAFYIYVALPVVISVIRSLLNGIFAAKWYPYIKIKPKGKLEKSEIKNLYKNVFGIAISKICTIINNSADSIIISAFVGVTLLGKYHNYQTLILMISSFVGILFTSLVPSVGNLNVEASKEHTKKIFDIMYASSFFIYGICAVCYFCVVQTFVHIWIGAENALYDNWMIVIMCLNFFTEGLCSTVNVYRSGCGLFYQGRYRPIFTVILKICLSVLFGHFWGIKGIIAATIASRMTTIWWFDAHIVYKHVFNKKVYSYLFDYIFKTVSVTLVGFVAYYLCSYIPYSGWAKIVLNIVVSAVVSVLGLFILCFKTQGLVYAKEYFISLLKKTLKR